MAYGDRYHEEFFGGDQAAEDADYHFNAQFDYVREAFGGQIDNEYEHQCNEWQMEEAEEEEWFARGCGMVPEEPFSDFDYAHVPF